MCTRTYTSPHVYSYTDVDTCLCASEVDGNASVWLTISVHMFVHVWVEGVRAVVCVSGRIFRVGPHVKPLWSTDSQ